MKDWKFPEIAHEFMREKIEIGHRTISCQYCSREFIGVLILTVFDPGSKKPEYGFAQFLEKQARIFTGTASDHQVIKSIREFRRSAFGGGHVFHEIIHWSAIKMTHDFVFKHVDVAKQALND